MGSEFINANSVGDHGVDVEATMVIGEDEIEGAKWIMDNVKFSVKEPIEAVATKEELEHLAMLCRSEADAMGRITAGILRLLKLDKSLGQGTIEQLRNLGMDFAQVILITFLYMLWDFESFFGTF
uniref:Uncharacterized protein n=1 Tax=Arundo donax TaxID=35708 RepID=A0A0A9BPP3_ARUDO